MSRRKHKKPSNYTGGAAFTRARKQFQILYEREGTFLRAVAAQELILWPPNIDASGQPVRPDESVLESWAREVDEGHADIPPKLRDAFNKRYDAFVEATVREALIENAKTAKVLAIQVREGKLSAAKSSQYMHANNATGFLLKTALDKRGVEVKPRQIRNMRLLAPKKRHEQLPEGTVEGQYREVSQATPV